MKNIAIIGATGMLGQPVAKEFIKAGFSVRILARDTGNAGKIFGSTATIIKGDVKNINSLKDFLKGADALYLNLSVVPTSSINDFQPEREGLLNVLQAAKESGITRIGYLSSLAHFYQGHNGFNWWVFDIKIKAVQLIKASGIPYSIFYPSTFMESFDKGGYKQGDDVALAGTSNYPMYLIAGSDCGKQVVKAFELNNGNNDFMVQGPEAYTADEAAKLFAQKYTRRKVKVMKMPFAVLKFMGLFTNKFNYGAHIIEALNNYPEKFESEITWQQLGKPQTTFTHYIEVANKA